MSCATTQDPGRTCQVVDYGSCCNVPMGDLCNGSRIKSKLKPVKLTTSTAKFSFTVPRQSVLDRPLASGWTLAIQRAGTSAIVAEYTIEEYITGTSQAVFFIDDVLRFAKKGYYVGTVNKDCCVVARVLMHLDCDKAIDVSTIDFTHDPCPVEQCDLAPKPAECCPTPCCDTQVISDPCGTGDYQHNSSCDIAELIGLDELEELNEECHLC
jgi:hypothetical protein